MSLPGEILDALRERPISPAEAVRNLFIASQAGSIKARLRLYEIAYDNEQSFLVRHAARNALGRLDLRYGPMRGAQ
jgi:hypothetical protein